MSVIPPKGGAGAFPTTPGSSGGFMSSPIGNMLTGYKNTPEMAGGTAKNPGILGLLPAQAQWNAGNAGAAPRTDFLSMLGGGSSPQKPSGTVNSPLAGGADPYVRGLLETIMSRRSGR